MKRFVILLLVLYLMGCTYGADSIKTLIADPHYAEYRKNLDEVERSYLNGVLDYSEHVEKKQRLDDDYAKEVQTREEIIHSE